MTTALREIALGVESSERALKLYRDILGFEVLRSGPLDSEAAALLSLGESRPHATTLGRPQVEGAPQIRMVETRAPVGRPSANTAALGPLGIGFTSPGIDHTVAELGEAGVRFLSPPIELTPDGEDLNGPRRFEDFGQASDGEFLVIIERRNVPTPYGTLSKDWLTSEPLHTSHVVKNLAAASRFMTEAMGHQMIFRETCSGEDFDRLMGLPSGVLFRFEMLQHPDHHTGRIIFIEYLDPPSPGDAAGGSTSRRQARGIQSLRYDSDDLDRTVEEMLAAGAEVLVAPRTIRSEAFGSGRVAVLDSPIGTVLEIWQPRT